MNGQLQDPAASVPEEEPAVTTSEKWSPCPCPCRESTTGRPAPSQSPYWQSYLC